MTFNTLWLGVVISALFVGFASSEDQECFKDTLDRCLSQWLVDQNIEVNDSMSIVTSTKGLPYCTWFREGLIHCILISSVQCDMSFTDIAAQAEDAIAKICTEGTTYNETVKNDPHCNMEVYEDYSSCIEPLPDFRHVIEGIIDGNFYCRNLDVIRKCMMERFEKLCLRSTATVFRDVYDSMYFLWKRTVCAM